MHEDTRTYIEVRHDEDTANVVCVEFRERPALPVETSTFELVLDVSELGCEPFASVKDVLVAVIESL